MTHAVMSMYSVHCLFCCSRIIDLPQEFIDYLHTDGVVLPESCEDTFDRTDFDSDDEVSFLKVVVILQFVRFICTFQVCILINLFILLIFCN